MNISALRKALGRGLTETESSRRCRAAATAFMASVAARDVPPGSVAVLPFASDCSDNNYLADGLTDATINGLVQLRSLRIAPRASAFRYKGGAVSPRDAGRELDVAAVVTSTVSQHGNNLRIQLDLVDVARDSQIWGAQYQGDVSELVHLQTRILQDLSRALRVPASDQETRRLARNPTGNSDAYRAYLQGRYEWNQRSEAALKRGIERFRHAVAIDPHFAAGYSGLADSLFGLGLLSYLSPVESFPEARRHAKKALELDASLAEAHSSLGFVSCISSGISRGRGSVSARSQARSDPRSVTPMVQYLSAGRRPTGPRHCRRSSSRSSAIPFRCQSIPTSGFATITLDGMTRR